MLESLNIVLNITVVILSTYIGYIKAKGLENRVIILRQFIVFLQYSLMQIKYNLKSTPEIIKDSINVLNDPLKTLIQSVIIFKEYTELNKNNSNNKMILIDLENKINKISDLKKCDKEIMKSFFSSFGKGDIENQENIINSSIKELEIQICEAQDIKVKTGKMYQTLGALAGVMLVIILWR